MGDETKMFIPVLLMAEFKPVRKILYRSFRLSFGTFLILGAVATFFPLETPLGVYFCEYFSEPVHIISGNSLIEGPNTVKIGCRNAAVLFSSSIVYVIFILFFFLVVMNFVGSNEFESDHHFRDIGFIWIVFLFTIGSLIFGPGGRYGDSSIFIYVSGLTPMLAAISAFGLLLLIAETLASVVKYWKWRRRR